jgi:hypothetical protein
MSNKFVILETRDVFYNISCVQFVPLQVSKRYSICCRTFRVVIITTSCSMCPLSPFALNLPYLLIMLEHKPDLRIRVRKVKAVEIR